MIKSFEELVELNIDDREHVWCKIDRIFTLPWNLQKFRFTWVEQAHLSSPPY